MSDSSSVSGSRANSDPVFVGIPRRVVEATINGQPVRVAEGATILDACREQGIDTPTLCYADTLEPVNACRVCVVEVTGSRPLVPACSRPVEDGMEITTDSERVRHSRRMVLELLDSAVDLSRADTAVHDWMEDYGVDTSRYGPAAPAAKAGERAARHAGHHALPDGSVAETVAQPPTIDNDLYVRDYARCILCYKCVQACGEQWQNTFAIGAAGRGFDIHIAAEFDAALPDSACVYCGNCIAVCPTGALLPRSEFDLREAAQWDPERQTVTRTVCSFCGVGCNLDLVVQDNRIVRVDSPADHSVTHGNLCIKGRFGYEHVQPRPDGEGRPA